MHGDIKVWVIVDFILCTIRVGKSLARGVKDPYSA